MLQSNYPENISIEAYNTSSKTGTGGTTHLLHESSPHQILLEVKHKLDEHVSVRW